MDLALASAIIVGKIVIIRYEGVYIIVLSGISWYLLVYRILILIIGGPY